LSSTGICHLELPQQSLSAAQELYSIFEAANFESLFALSHSESVEVVRNESSGDTFKFVLTHSQSTQSLRWLCVADSATLDVFVKLFAPEVQQSLSRVAGGQVEVNSACFIMVRDGVSDEECRPHYDFFSPEISRGSAFTLMTPMSADHPECVGGLEYWPWDGSETAHKNSDLSYRWDVRNLNVAVRPYRFGHATIIDGRILHRTQPYNIHTTSEVKQAGGYDSTLPLTEVIRSGSLRVLLCVYASMATGSNWPHIEQHLSRQVCSGYVRQPTLTDRVATQERTESSRESDVTAKAVLDQEAKAKKKGGQLLSRLLK